MTDFIGLSLLTLTTVVFISNTDLVLYDLVCSDP